MPRILARPNFIRAALAFFISLFACAELSAERLPLRVYTTADGLATSAAFNIVRDSRGFIWVSSRDGLVRFDGYRFINYRIGDGSADPAVYDVFTNRFGDYWINLNRGTDYKFTSLADDRVLEPFPAASDTRVPLPAQPTTGLMFPRFEDDEGQLWTADSNGLYKVNREGTSSETFPIELPGNPTGILALTEFRDARQGDGFWIGTNWGVVRRFPDGRMVHMTVDPEGNSDVIRPFAEDAEGRLWIVRQNTLVVMKTLPTFAMNANSRAEVSPGKVAADGSAAMPETPGTAYRFDLIDVFNAFSREQRTAQGMGQPIVASLFVDSSGNVWLPSTQGLAKFDGKRFHHYTTNNGLAMNDAGAMAEGLDGSLWFLSYGGLHRLNPNGLTSYDNYDGIERARIHNIQENKAGELVVVSGTFNVSTFDGRRFKSARPNIPADEI